ncbi:MAG TPA: tRNA (adenosine(37)-N6)-threonylcarbamoyltransferase complex ATPase subunit type 1 TsaE [Armatimonadetes bacterium]|nr:tRNA (adenosine(37)-N6)-threonylcarbamoyltransferase complex ATPase subunit type 1 TsaE [Armatimonadota bacterium]
MTVVTRSEEETKALGRALGRLLRPGDLVALIGELGTGKTVFVKGLAEGLGVEGEVISSSFVLMRRYKGKGTALLHIDLYRLSAAEVDDLALEEALSRGDAVVAVEWADRAKAVLAPEERMEVLFEHAEEGRKISFKPIGKRYQRVLGRLREVVGPMP